MSPALFGALLRHWRGRRGLSQLDLALAADVSARHVSFLETGRAQPSREMVLRLGASPPLAEGRPAPTAGASTGMRARREPFPMVVMNRRYDALRMNAGAARML